MTIDRYRSYFVHIKYCKNLQKGYKRIFDFIYKYKILNEKPFGFIKNKGTRDALSYTTKRIYEN